MEPRGEVISARVPSAQIPSRADFPITWEDPADALKFWTWEKMHFPHPVRPLVQTAQLRPAARGQAVAAERYNLPVRIRTCVFNGYAFQSVVAVSHDPAVTAELGRKAEATLRPVVQGLERTSNEEFLPELERDIATLRSFDASRASDAELSRHVAWVLDRLWRHWEIHFLLALPMALGIGIFLDLHAKLTGSADESAALVQLQGLPNKTVEGVHALWRLSRAARESAAVRSALDQDDPGAIFAALARTSDGEELARTFHAYLDQSLLFRSRRALLQGGQRLVERGDLAAGDDVMFLTADELRGALDSATGRDLRPLINVRKAEFARWQTLAPPPSVGTPPPPGAALGPAGPVGKGFLRFFGGPATESSSAIEIRGNAGSGGSVEGVARVVGSLEEASALCTGEILICPTTSPSWTPLFAIAAAIVTDTGGVLSHCAVVAREVGIPAVAGTRVATTAIMTGQRIAVDGAKGVVTILRG